MMGRDLFLGWLQGSEVASERRQRLYLDDDDRKLGFHLIGAPGRGKSKLLEHMIRQDILAGRGVCLIDPHGQTYEDVLEWCACFRPEREIIPINLSRGEHIVGFNPFICGPGDIAAQVERRIDAAVKAWGAANTDQTPRLEHWLRCLFFPLIEANDLTLLEADYFTTYTQARVRDYLTSRIRRASIQGDWHDLAAVRNADEFRNQIESTRNRLSRFLSADVARRFFALTDSEVNLDVGAAMDRGAVILVNLKWSDDVTRMNARLFGALLVNAFIEAAMRRPVGGGAKPRPFYLYLDEFHNFVTRDIGEALTQVRKFGLRFVLAHQLLKQLEQDDADVYQEVMTAVGARAVFGGINAEDAARLVPNLFAGQIDYTEVKYIHETVKYWQEYTRDKVITESGTETEAAAHADTDGTSAGTGRSTGSTGSGMTGHSVPEFFAGVGGGVGTRFDSSGWGSISSDSEMSGEMHATTESTSRARTTGRSVADVPLYRQIPYIEEDPRHYTADEQRERLAHALMLQYERHCFIRTPGGEARPLLVPFVKRYPMFEERVREYEAEMAQRAGALTPEEVDRIIAERRLRIEKDADVFLATRDAETVDLPYAVQSPAKLKRRR